MPVNILATKVQQRYDLPSSMGSFDLGLIASVIGICDFLYRLASGLVRFLKKILFCTKVQIIADKRRYLHFGRFCKTLC